jgi:RNA polymerase sigma factor (TIGR02999 family)
MNASSSLFACTLPALPTRRMKIALPPEPSNPPVMSIASPPTDPDIAAIVRASEIKEFMYELRIIARSLLAGEKNAQSIAPTMLVHTAFFRNTVRDNQWHDVTWANRQHFFADMVQAMRRSLIDRVRRYRAAKRPPVFYFSPDQMPVDFSADMDVRPERLELLDEALECLAQTKPDSVRLIHYHYYMGLTAGEIGQMIEVSEKTVDRDLKKARILLAEKMQQLSDNALR